MARVCDFTGKKTSFGRNRSHSMAATSRTFKPNLIVKYIDLGAGIKMKVKISASQYKKMKGMI